MSDVSNVIVMIDDWEENDCAKEINDYLILNNHSPLVQFNTENNAQGDKVFEVEIFGAALNCLNIPAFILKLGNISFEKEVDITAMIKPQEGKTFFFRHETSV